MPSTFRRGFKKDAEALALAKRAEIGLDLYHALDPWRLAEHLGVQVFPLTYFRYSAGDAVSFFAEQQPSVFSAVTIFLDPGHAAVVHNDTHSRPRQHSNITHELSHILLDHPPTPFLDALGCRHHDQRLEDEANWLCGALLIPEPLALHIARSRIPIQEAALMVGVSKEQVQFRLNVTGAKKRTQHR